MDTGGWYGRDNVFRTMTEVQFVAAMGTPGGGRTFITDRYLRHFNLVALSQVCFILLYSAAAPHKQPAFSSNLFCLVKSAAKSGVKGYWHCLVTKILATLPRLYHRLSPFTCCCMGPMP